MKRVQKVLHFVRQRNDTTVSPDIVSIGSPPPPPPTDQPVTGGCWEENPEEKKVDDDEEQEEDDEKEGPNIPLVHESLTNFQTDRYSIHQMIGMGAYARV